MTRESVAEHAKASFQEYDINNRGILGRTEVREFAKAMLKQTSPHTEFVESVFEEIFAQLDKKQQGFVSLDDLTEFYA